MGVDNAIFLEALEWFDETGQELLHRLPEHGSGDIKWGAQLTIRESQAGVLFYKGRACDAFGPGRHTLKTGNIPILTKILSSPWGGTSPLRAECYFVNLKIFTNLKWGTRDPVAFRDSDLGLIRLRAHGVFNIRIIQPVLFINSMAGTMGKYTTSQVEEYLRRVIISRFNDYLGEKLDTIFNLPGRFDELADGLKKRLAQDFSRFGLALDELYITSITPPEEVQGAIDDRSRLGVLRNDMEELTRMKAAMAIEKASEAGGEAGADLGMGMGLMMPAMFGNLLGSKQNSVQTETPSNQPPPVQCQDCQKNIPPDARFCPYCGHQQVILKQCANCDKNLTPGAKFCSRCGHPASEKPQPVTCPQCQAENIPGATFCNQCGSKLV